MTNLKPIETEYKGYRFRSRLEARWAVFFDSCGVEWEYEPEGFDLGDGIKYLPDFRLHGVTLNHSSKAENRCIYVEVKGQMNDRDAEKINRFHAQGGGILVVGNIPNGVNVDELIDSMDCASRGNKPGWPEFYNFETIDSDNFGAYPGVDESGTFNLFGADYSYLSQMDEEATEKAYRAARQKRFEFGEKGGL
ncbi:hypothetical protein [Ruminobacter sp. RM87]|uniref:hypothetical protein n=1 Tax=Ruminobacter sp. RM87 TaxID=1200567 RepID=UPI0004E241AA|nr:hypothetical protein [Ruminobacter sp. RM87]